MADRGKQRHPAPEAPEEPDAIAPRPPDPCIMVIFGATGDLTSRLLVPALHNLARVRLLPENFALLGVARGERKVDSLRQALSESIGGAEDSAAWHWLAERIFYMPGNIDDAKTYDHLKHRLAELDAKHGTGGNVLFYLATAPALFRRIITHLGEAGLVDETKGGWRRVVIEKPFGHDLPSARALDEAILGVLKEGQIYRIDHYLGKETVQNIMVFRFGNGIFEPIWNRDHIDHVQITVSETVGVERRGSFYDATGALRDMVPNHVFQLLSMTAMEPPNSFAADAVRSEKAKALDAVHPFSEGDILHNVVRGQYGPGMVEGHAMPAYRAEPDVDPRSKTETYVALKLMIDNWRWAGVPFYLRTGKAMTRRRSEIAIRFKPAPFALFRDTPVERLTPNWLILRIQPDEGLALQFGAKMPGPTMQLDRVKMDFRYKDYFAATPNTGYETLIYDCMIGDATLFQRADNIEAGWRVVQPLLEAWEAGWGAPPATYPAGSAGPAAADELLARDGRRWREIE